MRQLTSEKLHYIYSCVRVSTCNITVWGSEDNFRSWFSPSSMWALGIQVFTTEPHHQSKCKVLKVYKEKHAVPDDHEKQVKTAAVYLLRCPCCETLQYGPPRISLVWTQMPHESYSDHEVLMLFQPLNNNKYLPFVRFSLPRKDTKQLGFSASHLLSSSHVLGMRWARPCSWTLFSTPYYSEPGHSKLGEGINSLL